MNTGSFGLPTACNSEWVVADDMILDEVPVERESGIHPTLRCLMQGTDLQDALLQLCHDYVPSARVWSLVPLPRKEP